MLAGLLFGRQLDREISMKPGCLHLLAGLLLSATLVSPTQASDRSVRGVMIPPSSCQPYPQAGPDCIIPRGQLRGYLTGNAWTIFPTDCQFVLVCPLPINNIELGGMATDNDISKFRVHFRDPNPGSQVIARLIKSQVSGGTFISSSVCGGLVSAATTTPTTTTVSCPHDVAGAGTFYHFEVILIGAGTSSIETPSFYGIDFP